MVKVVLDTNVLISSKLSPLGNPNKIMDLLNSEEIELYYSTDILEEYQRVLAYERFHFSERIQTSAIADIIGIGELHEPTPSDIPLPDESDRVFYDLAKEVGGYLITGNKKHFPDEDYIVTPAEFLAMLEN